MMKDERWAGLLIVHRFFSWVCRKMTKPFASVVRMNIKATPNLGISPSASSLFGETLRLCVMK